VQLQNSIERDVCLVIYHMFRGLQQSAIAYGQNVSTPIETLSRLKAHQLAPFATYATTNVVEMFSCQPNPLVCTGPCAPWKAPN